MTKQGKKPLASKPKPTSTLVNHDEIFGNPLTISPELQKELDSQGLVPRFIDYKQIKDMDGYHTKGWKVYRKKKSDIIDSQEFKLGSAPDGIIRRGSLVLAVKTKEEASKHRRYLDERASLQRSSFQKDAANKFKQDLKNARLDSQVIEGYEDNE